LTYAAKRGHTEVVIELLSTGNVNPDLADKYGLTPLSWAAECGHKDVVIELLSTGNVNPNLADDVGRTPHFWAAKVDIRRLWSCFLLKKTIPTADGYRRTT
jgi:ankyrin repeat protein